MIAKHALENRVHQSVPGFIHGQPLRIFWRLVQPVATGIAAFPEIPHIGEDHRTRRSLQVKAESIANTCRGMPQKVGIEDLWEVLIDGDLNDPRSVASLKSQRGFDLQIVRTRCLGTRKIGKLSHDRDPKVPRNPVNDTKL